MKLAYVLAGAAALALAAGAASAQTAPGIIESSTGGSNITLNYNNGTVSNGSAGNVADATFNLSANVAEDCSFFTGGGDVDIDFGTLGIFNTSTQGLGNAFEMTGPASAQVETSVAGCNTANVVEVRKANGADGMEGDNPGGYDEDRFQNNLPYIVRANYRAAGPNAITSGTRSNWVVVDRNDGVDRQRHGAWKSDMRLTFVVPVAQKALVAGEYTDSVTVTLSAL